MDEKKRRFDLPGETVADSGVSKLHLLALALDSQADPHQNFQNTEKSGGCRVKIWL